MTTDFIPWAHLYLLPPLITIALWVGLTVGLLRLNRAGAVPAQIVLLLTLPLVVFIHHELSAIRHDLSVWGSYRAFISGMLIWAWHELAFYSGVLAGPWRSECPVGCSGSRRFGYAMGTHLYHELAVVGELLLLMGLHADATNFIAPLTFGLFWLLQHSAKLNVFLGTRHLDVDLLPDHLRYLGSFWRKRRGNPFMPVALVAMSLLVWFLWSQANTLPHAGGTIGAMLLAALVLLGLLEHLLLLLPPLRVRAQRTPLVSPVDAASVRSNH